jgi:PRC-barrel domain
MSVGHLTLLETFPIEDGHPSGEPAADPVVRLSVDEQKVRLRRSLSSKTGRTWLLEIEVAVDVPDPEQILVACQGFVADGSDGEALGVIEDVEVDEATGLASTFVLATGWFGRRRLRVPAEHVELVAPNERRVVLRAPASGFAALERQE